MQKTFRTLQEQMAILRGKGLIIEDEIETEEILLRENYFFISGYRHLFLKGNEDRSFIDGTTFKELFALFNFDRQIRNIIFKNILIIENNVKSIFSYQLSKKYGFKEDDYLNPSNFDTANNKTAQVSDLLRKMKRQIRVNGSQHSATSHYIEHYGYIPTWVVVKVLSFGLVSELYLVMKDIDQEDIAQMFKVDVEHLLIYLPLLANYRNLCAHEDIVYNHRTQRSILDTRFHEKLGIPLLDGEYVYGKNDLFALVIMLKELLHKDAFNLFIHEITYEIDILAGKIKSIDIGKILDALGFPENYKEMVRIE